MFFTTWFMTTIKCLVFKCSRNTEQVHIIWNIYKMEYFLVITETTLLISAAQYGWT